MNINSLIKHQIISHSTIYTSNKDLIHKEIIKPRALNIISKNVNNS